MTFWNGSLVEVDITDVFVIGGVNLIGSNFKEIGKLLPDEQPVVEDLDAIFFAGFDRHNLELSMDLDWIIRSVGVGINPDELES